MPAASQPAEANARELMTAGWHGARGRLVSVAWPLLQGTAAATAAWLIARHVVGNPDPFFAPIAAVAALNASVGERGRNALRLLLGVVVGIVIGDVAVAVLGRGDATLAVAVGVAMTVAVALGGARIVIAQAAAGAILTVAVAEGDTGSNRLVDALIGGGVALVFTQFLFSPEPVALVRRAESVALADLAVGLELTAQGLEQDDDALAARGMATLRELRDRLTELARTRRASVRMARRSLVWRSQRAPAVRESENAGHLDLLGGSCLMLVRTAIDTSPSERLELAPPVRTLATALGELGSEPGDRVARQRAADRALDVARASVASEATGTPSLAAALMTMRLVAADIMVFAGADIDDAFAAVRQGDVALRVTTPPPAPRTPFGLLLRWGLRWIRQRARRRGRRR